MPRARIWVVLLVLAALLPALFVLLPGLGADAVRTRALPRVEERLGRQIHVGDVKVHLGSVELTDVIVDGAGASSPLAAPRITIGYALWSILFGPITLTTVRIEHPRLALVRGEAGEDNVSSILDKLRARKEASTEGDGEHRGRRGPERIEIVAGTLLAANPALGEVEAAGIDAEVLPHGEGKLTLHEVEVRLATGPAGAAKQVELRFTLDGSHLVSPPTLALEGGSVRIWRGFALSGIAGTVGPDATDAARVLIDLHGGYGGVDKVLWSASGNANPTARQGTVQLKAERFALSQLAPILIDTPVVDPEQTQIDARLDLNYRGDPADHAKDEVDFDGHFELSGLNVFSARLGPQVVRNLGFEASAKGHLLPKQRALRLDKAVIDYRGIRATIDVEASKIGQKTAIKGMPAFKANLHMEPVSCQTVLGAIPAELTPALQGFKTEGKFGADMHLAIDPDDLETMELGAKIGIDGCSVTAAPPAFDVRRIMEPFLQAVEVEPGNWLVLDVGPGNPEWVPYKDISPHLVNSIMTTEDSNFMNHRGFIAREFKSALKSNLEHGYFRLGASSITMQMVKNVLLSREKTLSRKLQEMFLTWYLERHLSKERILEIYFNVIEFGPGIYGIGRAAHHYFGKSAKELLPREAAWFSSILPNPKRRYAHTCSGDLDTKWELYLNRILRRMNQRGRLTDELYTQALDSRLHFNRAEALSEAACLDLIRRLTDPQNKLNGNAKAILQLDRPWEGDEAAPEAPPATQEKPDDPPGLDEEP